MSFEFKKWKPVPFEVWKPGLPVPCRETFLYPADFSPVLSRGAGILWCPKYSQSWSGSTIMKILCRQVLENFNFLLLANNLWCCALMCVRDNLCFSCMEFVKMFILPGDIDLTVSRKLQIFQEEESAFYFKGSHRTCLWVPLPQPGKPAQSLKVHMSWPQARDWGVRLPAHSSLLLSQPLTQTYAGIADYVRKDFSWWRASEFQRVPNGFYISLTEHY